MNKNLNDILDLRQLGAKNTNQFGRYCTFVFVILVTLRWQFLAQPIFFEFAFTDRIIETGFFSDASLLAQL